MLKGIENIEGLTPEQIEAINAQAKGLSDKNAELLAKVADKNNSGAESAAELEKLRQFKQSAEIKAAEDAKNWEEASRLKDEQHQAELKKLTGEIESSQGQLKTLLINDGLSAALDGVNINKDLKAGAVAMLQSGAKIVEGKAMIGEKSLSDAVKEWADSEQGKPFVLAPENSGGDGNGGDSKASTPEPKQNEKAEEAKSNKDLDGYIAASISDSIKV